MNILDNFRIGVEKEDFQTIKENICNGIYFKGTNLWILIFAIFIASLGLNVNSTAVIIGAMLISPLMGPIMGIGFSMATNDLSLLKKSGSSLLFATIVSLLTSTIYFTITPLSDAHSEILARTSPTIYDVLIAIFGGMAIILAYSSKLKGNVIPGVAIATALMPPLCTAGYGLATLQFNYFFGAFYLFIINAVFISLSTYTITKVFKFPLLQLHSAEETAKTKRIIWGLIIITILPSIYFGYTLVQQNKFEHTANQFIDTEAVFENDYLLKREIDAKNNSIVLTYGGELIDKNKISLLKNKLSQYNLNTATLQIRQGFAYLKDNPKDQLANQLVVAKSQIKLLEKKSDSLNIVNNMSQQISNELKIQYPFIESSTIENAIVYTASTNNKMWIVILQSQSNWNSTDKVKIIEWLKIRMNTDKLKVYFE